MESSVDPLICSKCRLCIKICPCNVLGLDETENTHFIEERKTICIQCGQCMAVCKTGAITVQGLSYANHFREMPENRIKYDDFIGFLSTRRSVRNFAGKPVSRTVINRMLESVCYAPFGAAPEKMNITVVNDRERIKLALPHIERFLDNIVKWIESPLACTIMKVRNSREKFRTVKDHLYPIARLDNYKLEFGDRITRNAPAMIIFHAPENAEAHTDNGLIHATYAMLSAHSLGLGATMNGIVPAAINKVREVREIFRIPPGDEAVMSLIVGYPKYKYRRTIRRDKHRINWIDSRL